MSGGPPPAENSSDAAAGELKDAADAGPPSPTKDASAVPATVEITPDGPIFRIRLLRRVCNVEAAGTFLPARLNPVNTLQWGPTREGSVNIWIPILLLVSAAAGATAQAPDLNQLSWMAGAWSGTQERTQMEEHWTAPLANSMLGMHRDVTADKTVSFEFLRIEKRPGGIVYVAQPRGNPPTDFAMVEMSGQRVVFENKAHDFPQRIIYWSEPNKPDVLNARVEGTQNGRSRSIEWSWRRAR